jgi:phage capsid family
MPDKHTPPSADNLRHLSRFASFERSTVNTETRTVEVAFSSELPVERWFGTEILSHEPDACDLSRLNNGAAALFMHKWDKQIGVIERAWIDDDRKGRALIRFGSGAFAAEKWQDVQDGILRHISVGYDIREYTETVRDGEPTITATRWLPYEVSFVTVPADPTVGVGRSCAEPPADTAGIPESQPQPTPNDEGNRAMSKNTAPNTVPAAAADHENTAERGMLTERERVGALLAIGRAYADQGGIEAAERVIAEGGGEAQLRAAIMDNMRTQPTVTSTDIGLTGQEQQRFSILRALDAAATGRWDKAGFEREVSDAIEKRTGRPAAGVFIPTDIMARAYSKGSAAGGGHTVADELRPDLFIELLRNRLAVAQLGATVLDGLVGDITIPKQLTGNTVKWVDENGAADESSATFGQIGLKPKTVTANTELSRKFMLQSSLSAEQFARDELIRAMMLAVDLAAINGKGSNGEPVGVLNTTGIGAVEIGANGGAVEWKHVVALESAIAAANADLGNLAYLTNARLRGYLKTKLKSDGVDGYIWADGAAPLNGYPCAVSNQVPADLTKGSAAGKCSALVFGNWSDLLIAHWGVLDVVVDPYTKSTSGALKITVLQDVDIAVRHPESFAAIKDALV